MAASPHARDRKAVSWHCSRGRSLVLHLTLLLKFIACGFRLMFSFGHDANFFFFVIDQRIRRNTRCQKNIRADSRMCANHSVATHDSGSGVNTNAVFNRRVAFLPAQPLSRPERARDERDALVKFYVRPDLGGLTNNDTGPVIDEEMGSNLCAGMNIDAG